EQLFTVATPDGAMLGPMHQIVRRGYEARGGADPDLPGNASVTSPFGRADIRLQMDSDGELFILSKSDGMIRYLAAGFAAGDFNQDGIVDGHDFLAWQRDPGIGRLADWQADYGS